MRRGLPHLETIRIRCYADGLIGSCRLGRHYLTLAIMSVSDPEVLQLIWTACLIWVGGNMITARMGVVF